MKFETTFRAGEARRASFARVLMTLCAGVLFVTGPAWGEGGGDPIADQAGAVRAQREAEALGRASNYEREFARAHPGDPRNVVRSPRSNADTAQRNHAGRSQRYYSDRSHGYYGRESNHYSGQRYRSYAYGAPYYASPPLAYDPYPSPGISLFFSF